MTLKGSEYGFSDRSMTRKGIFDTCPDETISAYILASGDALQHKTVPGILGDSEVSQHRRQQVRGQLNEDWNAVSEFLIDNYVCDRF